MAVKIEAIKCSRLGVCEYPSAEVFVKFIDYEPKEIMCDRYTGDNYSRCNLGDGNYAPCIFSKWETFAKK